MSTRGWLVLAAGITGAYVGLVVAYARAPAAVAWWDWGVTVTLGVWFGGGTWRLFRRWQRERQARRQGRCPWRTPPEDPP